VQVYQIDGDQNLLLQEKAIGGDGPGAAWSEETGERC
jgi:hypothetical protein